MNPEKMEILSEDDSRRKAALELGLDENTTQKEINQVYKKYESLSDKERQRIDDENKTIAEALGLNKKKVNQAKVEKIKIPEIISEKKTESEREQYLHIKARKEKPKIYPDRFPVPDEKVKWEVSYPEYDPPYFVADSVLENDVTKKINGWADPENIKQAKERRNISSYEGNIIFDYNGFPHNPMGRTGIEGRGLLGKWGANFAGDPIITRINPGTGDIEMLAIQRKDNSQWAIPGGMVEKGENIFETLRRELKEETGVDVPTDDANQVYQGYVDDPRNTDSAWMETWVGHKHLSPDIAEKVNPRAGDDARKARWFALNKKSLANLYASHGEFLKKALQQFYDSNLESLSPRVRRQIENIINQKE